MEEAPFLTAVDRIVRGVQVERDARRRARMCVQEQIDEGRLNGAGIMSDLVVAMLF